jgi:hypothetical protein
MHRLKIDVSFRYYYVGLGVSLGNSMFAPFFIFIFIRSNRSYFGHPELTQSSRNTHQN